MRDFKLILGVIFFSFVSFQLNAQQNIGINTKTPNPNAALDVQPFGKQGVLIPRLDAVDTTSALSSGSLSSSDKGLIFYDTTGAQFLYFSGSNWRVIETGGAVGDNLGNHSAITNVTLGGNYISRNGTSNGIALDNSNSVLVSRALAVGFTSGSITQDNLYIGDIDFRIDMQSPTNPKIYFDQNDLFNFDRNNNRMQYQISGANIYEVLGNGDFILNNLSSSTALKLVTANAAGKFDTIAFTGNNTEVLLGNGTFGTIAGDDLGNHIMTDTLETNGNWISNDGDAEGIFVDATGNVGIGMQPSGSQILEINGNLKTAGITETSDKRYKKNINEIMDAISKVMQLRGVMYDWRKDDFPNMVFEDRRQMGLVAQEVEQIIPEIVNTDANGYKSIEYSKLVALLIQAVKEQQIQIALQEKVNQEQDQKIKKLEANYSKVEDLTREIESIKYELGVDAKASK